eukprot:gene37196-45150_t
MDSSGERAYEVFREYELLPKTLTRECVEKVLNVSIKGPSMGDVKPFQLSASFHDGRPAMVKVLRIDKESALMHTQKIAEFCMEREALCTLDFSAKQPGLIICAGSTKGLDRYSVELLGRQARKMLETLEYIHLSGIVHMDVKGDYIFIDSSGDWKLGDFGSCNMIGELVISNLVGQQKAEPAFDYFMLSMTLLIELLPKKHAFFDELCAPQECGVMRASLEKVNAFANDAKSTFPALHELIEEIINKRAALV